MQEEYDEDEEVLEEEDLENGRDSEEDPRVIKELVDLIKKLGYFLFKMFIYTYLVYIIYTMLQSLGGVEQLEKHLANSAHNSQATTPPTIKKLFYERVLSQPRAQNERYINIIITYLHNIGSYVHMKSINIYTFFSAPPQQNSRGPQTLGLSAEKEDKVVNSRRERPQ